MTWAQSRLPLVGPLLAQVVDGFFVKRTADIKESAAYLALLTRGLERLHQVSSARAWRRSLNWALGSLKEGEVSEIPVSRTGPLGPRV